MENNTKNYITFVKLKQKNWKNNIKIYIQLLHNMRYYFLFYAKRTHDTKLIFNASKLTHRKNIIKI